jgi:hypothetical protein
MSETRKKLQEIERKRKQKREELRPAIEARVRIQKRTFDLQRILSEEGRVISQAYLLSCVSYILLFSFSSSPLPHLPSSSLLPCSFVSFAIASPFSPSLSSLLLTFLLFSLQKAEYFQSSHFEEIIEERSAGGFCGYPTCTNPLSNEVSASLLIPFSPFFSSFTHSIASLLPSHSSFFFPDSSKISYLTTTEEGV